MPLALARRTPVLALLAALLAVPIASAQDARSSRLADFGSVDRAEWHSDRDVPLFLAGDLGPAPSADVFFRAHAAAFGFDEAPDVRVTRTETDALGLTHVRVQQTVDGVPVWGAESALHLRDGQVYAWGGDLYPDAVGARTAPALGAAASVEAAKRALGPVEYRRSTAPDALADGIDWTPRSRLVVFPHDDDFRLAYHVTLYVESPSPANWEVFVDAQSGREIHRYNSIHTVDAAPEAGVPYARRASASLWAGPETGTGASLFGGTYTLPTFLSGGAYYLYDTTRGPQYIRTMSSNGGNSLPGSYVTDADNSFSASAAVDAHYGAVSTFDYYKNTHGRSSYDGNNAAITSTVNYDDVPGGAGYNNAFWNGQQMVYGDGDGSTFRALVDLDIAAHELSHAVTEATGGLIYQKESGALNEAFSDIMAVMVDRNDYLVGENSYTPGVSGDALRYLDDPTRGGQPAHYDDRLYPGSCSPARTNDYCGVHSNSGIANKQAYLMIAGGTFRGVAVGAVGRGVTEKVWYRAMASYFTSSTTFAGARQGTIQAATDLYGAGSSQVASVTNAWAAVGVGAASGGGGGGGGGGTPEWRYETRTYQSPHNYPNNYTNTKTYSKPGAQRVAMYFEQFATEANYDFVTIQDGGGATTATYTGSKAAFWAIVDGDAISVTLTSDYSVTAYGYRVTRVAYFSGQALAAGSDAADPSLGFEPQEAPSDVRATASAKAEGAELALGSGRTRPAPGDGAGLAAPGRRRPRDGPGPAGPPGRRAPRRDARRRPTRPSGSTRRRCPRASTSSCSTSTASG